MWAPSADVRTPRAADWMAAFEENGGILDGILAITHPTLYRAAQDAMETMWREHASSRAIMATWPSCFSALQVIINRSTLGHRDCHGAPGWYDLLVTLGPYGQKAAVLELHGLGISVPYGPGSVVPLSSKLLIHGVPKVRGERVCYAFYMYSEVLKRFDVPVDEVTYSNAFPHAQDGPLDILDVARPHKKSAAASEVTSGSPEDEQGDGLDTSEVPDGIDGGDVEMAM